MVRTALSSGYLQLDQYRKDFARHKAEQQAVLDGKPKDEWLSYYERPRDLQAGLGTVEGIIQHFADLEQGEVGAGSVNSSEIGTELLTNGNMTDIIKTISIAYDLGKIPAKVIKSSENQTPSITALPINALFFGSQDAILYDNAIKNKFKTIFSTQLARRSIFSFSPEQMKPLEFKSIQELTDYRSSERDRTIAAQKLMLEQVAHIVEHTTREPLELSPEAQSLFDVYKEYNALVANRGSAQYQITNLARRHKQWLALKLSGVFAILDENSEITAENYIIAINTVEVFSNDLKAFEQELIKEPYEIFVEFCKYKAEDGKFSISLHELRKMNYIPMSGSPKTKIEELVTLASSYDKDGVYTGCADGICYEELVRTDVAGVSFIQVSGTKEQRMKQCASGYEFYETDFEELGAMLSEDFAYTPFQFKDGIRKKENLLGGCKWVVLDVDDSAITDEEAHFMLSDINHHIARTSDAKNAFKFRVLLELDSITDISDLQWKYFITSLSTDLGITADILPKSQIYFSYSDRNVLSVIDADPIEAKEYILKSADMLANSSTVMPKKLSTAQQKQALEQEFITFAYAFEVENGGGSRALIRAAKHAHDLGLSVTGILDLIDRINNFWSEPMDEERLENTIKSQIRRWS